MVRDGVVAGIDEIDKVVKWLDKKINGQDIVVLLRGDLASGKTTLVKEYVAYLGVNEEVTSPTFSLQSIYGNTIGNTIFHYDIYNKSIEEFLALGLLEEFEKSGIHFVEWGDEKLESLLKKFGFKVLIVQIKQIDNKREYECIS